LCFSSCHCGAPQPLTSFPTRRSSDLVLDLEREVRDVRADARAFEPGGVLPGDVQDLHAVLRGEALRLGVSGHGDGLHDGFYVSRSEEHTSELQSQSNLVCRLLLEKKK